MFCIKAVQPFFLAARASCGFCVGFSLDCLGWLGRQATYLLSSQQPLQGILVRSPGAKKMAVISQGGREAGMKTNPKDLFGGVG